MLHNLLVTILRVSFKQPSTLFKMSISRTISEQFPGIDTAERHSKRAMILTIPKYYNVLRRLEFGVISSAREATKTTRLPSVTYPTIAFQRKLLKPRIPVRIKR